MSQKKNGFVLRTHPISNHLYVSMCSMLYLSHNSRGVMPSFKACVSVAVPYSSVPQTYNVLRFLVRLYLRRSAGNQLEEPAYLPTEYIGAQSASDNVA